ncbi:MAG: SAM-dependent methyltransferase [Bacteroidia bacterium]|nr:SAM-dependent methyltransferase [Bacteroidia bacterium]
MHTATDTEGPLPRGLYVFAAPLGPEAAGVLPASALRPLLALRQWWVESEKGGRRFLLAGYRAAGLTPAEARERLGLCQLGLLNEHTGADAIGAALGQLAEGPVGLVSDGGAAAVADPGAPLVLAAHGAGAPVYPQVGPSALVLALMAAGLNGQGFTFHGYPPREAGARVRWIRDTERQSQHTGHTQLCIEAPYRTEALVEALVATLQPSTLLCVAADLTQPTQWIATRAVERWRATARPTLKGVPAVVLWWAEGR